MSSKYQSQIWDKKPLDLAEINNKALNRLLVAMLREHHPHKLVENVACDLGIKAKRVKNWMYEGTGMTARDLLLLMQKYDFIREWVMDAASE